MRDPNPFGRVFFDVLLREKLTPRLLAERSGLSEKSIGAWVLAMQVPTALSLWRATESIPRHRLKLFRSAIRVIHKRSTENYKDGEQLRFDKSVSAYLGQALDKIPPETQQEFIGLWKELLRSPSTLEVREPPEAPIAEIIDLPVPTVLILDDWREIAAAIAADATSLHELHWKKFEDLVARMLESFGWAITPMGYTQDQGIDLLGVTKVAPGIDFSMMVQCKRYSPTRKVGIELVREVWSVKWKHGFHHAMIATTSTFTKGALSQGEEWRFSLEDQDSILKWCRTLSTGHT